jgi:hypothetical protein
VVPVHTQFAFAAHIPAAGYQWVSPNDVKLRKLVDTEKRPVPDCDVLLIQAGQPNHDEEQRVWRWPDTNPVLFREFADLSTDDLDALLGFANENGSLGFGHIAVCDPRTATSYPNCLVWEDPEYPGGRAALLLGVETYREWVTAIAHLKTATTVFDRLQARDATGMRKYLVWHDTGAREAREHLPTHLSDRDKYRRPDGAWYLDTHPHIADKESGGSARINDYIATGTTPTRYDDPLTVGWTWLVQAVNHQLRNRVSPQLWIDPDGRRLIEQLHPQDLLSAMWAQLYRAMTAGKIYRNCKACAKWFEISGDDEGYTTRRMYCSDVCRVRAYRGRRDRAAMIAAAGKSAKEVSEQLAAEGMETDLATVKKWVRNIKPRGKK